MARTSCSMNNVLFWLHFVVLKNLPILGRFFVSLPFDFDDSVTITFVDSAGPECHSFINVINDAMKLRVVCEVCLGGVEVLGSNYVESLSNSPLFGIESCAGLPWEADDVAHAFLVEIGIPDIVVPGAARLPVFVGLTVAGQCLIGGDWIQDKVV